MAAGSIKLQANDTRIATVTFEDGAAGNVSVVVPKEGGVLASEGYAVAKSGDETIAGIKTFSSSPIVPNATTATQAIAFGQSVNLTAAQTIAGIKTFTSSPIVPVPTLVNQAISMGNIIEKTGAGIGYGTGSGGVVTQLTSKSTAVTLNKPCGQIIMNNASLAAGVVVAFVCSNTSCLSVDTAVASISANGSGFGEHTVSVVAGNNSIIFYVKNVTAGALSNAIVINFAVIKGATA